MKMKISVGAVKPEVRIVNQVNRLGGRWSMKISHSASPRNRSSRSSRSPTTGNEIADAATAGAVTFSRTTGSVAPARGGEATRSAMDVIRHRLVAGVARRHYSFKILSVRGLQAKCQYLARHQLSGITDRNRGHRLPAISRQVSIA